MLPDGPGHRNSLCAGAATELHFLGSVHAEDAAAELPPYLKTTAGNTSGHGSSCTKELAQSTEGLEYIESRDRQLASCWASKPFRLGDSGTTDLRCSQMVGDQDAAKTGTRYRRTCTAIALLIAQIPKVLSSRSVFPEHASRRTKGKTTLLSNEPR